MDAAGLALTVLSTLAAVVEKGREVYKDYESYGRFLETMRLNLLTQELLLRDALKRYGRPDKGHTGSLESYLKDRREDGLLKSDAEVDKILNDVKSIYDDIKDLMILLEVPPDTAKEDQLSEKIKNVFGKLKKSRRREKCKNMLDGISSKITFLSTFSDAYLAPLAGTKTDAQNSQNRYYAQLCQETRGRLQLAYRALDAGLCHGCDPPHKAIIYLDEPCDGHDHLAPDCFAAISYGRDQVSRPWRKATLKHSPTIELVTPPDLQAPPPRDSAQVTPPPENSPFTHRTGSLCEIAAIGSGSSALPAVQGSLAGNISFGLEAGRGSTIATVASIDTTYRVAGRPSRKLEEKYRMAMHLAWTVLHFGDTLWMESTLDTSWAKVFKEEPQPSDGDSVEFSRYPCLMFAPPGLQHGQPATPPTPEPETRLAPYVTNTAIFTVGILIAELFLASGPGNDTAPAQSKPISDRAVFATKSFRDIVNDAGWSYATVVNKCIKLAFLEDNIDLGRRDFREEFYSTVFAPLAELCSTTSP